MAFNIGVGGFQGLPAELQIAVLSLLGVYDLLAIRQVRSQNGVDHRSISTRLAHLQILSIQLDKPAASDSLLRSSGLEESA